MEEAQKMRLTNVWLECDSALVCVAFTAKTNVPAYEMFVLINVGKLGLRGYSYFS